MKEDDYPRGAFMAGVFSILFISWKVLLVSIKAITSRAVSKKTRNCQPVFIKAMTSQPVSIRAMTSQSVSITL